MSRQPLETYLNDHLAGSIGALQLLERMIRENEGDAIADRLARLREEIESDQVVLRGLIERLGAEDPLKRAGAWVSEKLGRLKLGGTDEPGELPRLEALETLQMGVQGKLALWRALRVVADRHEVLRGLDFDRLEGRAREQHGEVEEMRLAAARSVL